MQYFDELSNWGRWGDDDELGCLNYVTADVRQKAAGLVSEGISVSCALDIVSNQQQADDMLTTPSRVMLAPGPGDVDLRQGAWEHISMVFHGRNITHIDALAHNAWDGKLYGGRPLRRTVNQLRGARSLSVLAVRDGVTTRGVLLDVARSRAVPYLGPGYRVTPEDLEEAERRQGVRVSSGDAVFLRTGYARHRRDEGPASPADGWAGWDASCLPWLHERQVAVIGSDVNNEASPSGYEGLALPMHCIGITVMGLWLVDNCDLEALGDRCAELGRWAYQLLLCPLRLIGCTGSPVNPIALF
jgi:kynurenine formamidase